MWRSDSRAASGEELGSAIDSSVQVTLEDNLLRVISYHGARLKNIGRATRIVVRPKK
jgi:hypothetical protein